MLNRIVQIGIVMAMTSVPLVGLALEDLFTKEVARVPFATEATGDATAQLDPGRVDFWTDLRMVYTGDPTLEYRIDLVQRGVTVASAVCDPRGPMDWSMHFDGETAAHVHTLSSKGKMRCSTVLQSGGPTTVRVTLAYGATPAKVAISKADLVVKQ